eukprot:m.316291 g.316291  ORF g.316291 m.316291 type:complete len:82 (+) comp16422_c2_seq2:761-1006(+)
MGSVVLQSFADLMIESEELRLLVVFAPENNSIVTLNYCTAESEEHKRSFVAAGCFNHGDRHAFLNKFCEPHRHGQPEMKNT